LTYGGVVEVSAKRSPGHGALGRFAAFLARSVVSLRRADLTHPKHRQAGAPKGHSAPATAMIDFYAVQLPYFFSTL